MLFIWANFALREGQLERERERGGVVRAKGKQRLGDALVLSFILFYFPLDFPSARRMPPLTLISPWAKVLLYFFFGQYLEYGKMQWFADVLQLARSQSWAGIFLSFPTTSPTLDNVTYA